MPSHSASQLSLSLLEEPTAGSKGGPFIKPLFARVAAVMVEGNQESTEVITRYFENEENEANKAKQSKVHNFQNKTYMRPISIVREMSRLCYENPRICV